MLSEQGVKITQKSLHSLFNLTSRLTQMSPAIIKTIVLAVHNRNFLELPEGGVYYIQEDLILFFSDSS